MMGLTSFKKPRLLLGTAVLLGLVLSACGTNPQPSMSTVTVTVDGAGVGTVTSMPVGIDVTSGADADTLEVANGTEVTLTAVAAAGSTFTGWTGDCAGTADCVFEVDGDAAVTATFAVTTDTVTVETDGTGTGNVVSDPAGIDLDGGNASATFTGGTEVTLTATPASGSGFGGWDGECMGQGSTCTFTFTEATTITATFTETADALIVATDGAGAGNVVSDPAGIDLDAGDASATFSFGTDVTLTATADTGSTFVDWDGACAGQGATCTFSFTDGTTITATFALEDLTLDVNVVNGGTADGSVTSDPAGIDTGIGDGSADFEFGSNVTLTAEASAGGFAGWVGGGCDDVMVPVCTVAMDAAKNVVAAFNDIQTQTVRVAAGGDDALEFLGDSAAGAGFTPPQWFEGWVWAIRPNVHLGWSVYHNLAETAFRFPGVAVPEGARVHSATLQVTSAGQEDDQPATGDLSLTIQGELSTNPDGFTQPAVTETSFAITQRPRTTADVMWDITGAWATNTVHQAPEAASILQEIVAQPSWSAGNAVVLFLSGGSLAEQNYRRVLTFESGGDPVDRHPTLFVEYVVMPPL